jgi:hypothetical protein
MFHFIIRQTQVVHHQDESLPLPDLISFKQQGSVFVNGEQAFFVEFEGHDVHARLLLQVHRLLTGLLILSLLRPRFEVNVIVSLVLVVNFLLLLRTDELLKGFEDFPLLVLLNPLYFGFFSLVGEGFKDSINIIDVNGFLSVNN